MKISQGDSGGNVNFKPRKILTSKPFLIIVGLLLAYFLFAYFAVDPLARRILPWVAENKLASRMTVERVAFDPLRLSLTVDNLRLTRADGAPLAGFERLFVDLESSGLFKFAWRLRDIRLTAPNVVMDVAPDDRFNWADLIAKLNEDPTPEEDSEPARVLIDHILIERGNVEYTERNRPQPFRTVLQPLGLELEGLSTLPESRGDYLLSAKLPEQGGTIKWKGDLALNPLASKGAIEIQQIDLAKLMQIVNSPSLPLRLNDSRLDSSFSYDFSLAQDGAEPVPQAHLSDIAIQLTDTAADLESGAKVALAEAGVQLPALDFTMRDGAQVRFQGLDFTARQLALTQDGRILFNLPEASVTGVDFDTAQNQLKIAEVLLKDGAINASRAKDGSFDWQRLVPAAATTTSEDTTAPAPQAAEATAPVTGSKATGDIAVDQPAAGQPSASPTANTAEAAKATAPPFGFDIGSVQLQNWQIAYADQTFVRPLRAAIAGISLSGAVGNTDGAVAVRDFNAELGKTTLQSANDKQPIASLAKASLQDGQVDLQGSTVRIGAIRLSGLQTEVLRETGKPLNWQTVLAQLPASGKPEPAKPAASPSPWKVALGELALDGGSVHFADRSTPTPVVLDVQKATINLLDGSLDLSRPLPVKAALQLKQGGRLEASGKLTLSPFRSDLQIKASGVALRPFSPYVNQAALLRLDQGQASLHGKLTLAAKKDFTGKFAGGFSIDNLAINEEPGDVLFLGWRSVSSNSLKLDIAPNRLHLNELRIVEPVGKFIIYEDRTLNVSRILRQPSGASEAKAVPAPAAASSDDPAFPMAVERVSIVDGDLEFADLSLTPQFGTHINTLSGVINGLSSDPATTAQVELDGKVDEYGSARIRGSVQPFQATEYTDLKLVFRNLEMNRLTPYSGKFAGRKIDSGKLSVDLEYKIKDRKLAGENKFVITRLKLGERVESPDAVSLPLDLAIALLQDSNGVIDLDLPIAGSLDDPQFSYGKIIWKAVLNVIGKVVTSPFRALGNLLGIGADKLEAVAFEPGKSALAPEEQEQLKAVGEAMKKRTALTLAIAPAYDPVADKAALQQQATRRDVARELGLQLADGETPGPVDLNNVKVQTAVENLLKDRRGEKRDLAVLDSLKDYFSKPKPEDLPKYQAMLEQLEATVDVTEAELTALAQVRAAALRDYLLQKAGLAPERVAIGKPVKTNGDGKAVRVKLELGVASKPAPEQAGS